MIVHKKIFVQKANGEREPFSELKLARSLSRSGSSPKLTESIVRHIRDGLKDGMKTRDIYSRAIELLGAEKVPLAARYSLKEALMEMGPSGHPFEALVGEIMKTLGCQVSLRQTLKGRCVNHEVDVVARKGNRHIMVETKFHNSHGFKSDVKIPLYVKARFDDILQSSDRKQHIHEAWLVTNTKFSQDAIKYGRCNDMNLIGWDYPSSGSLQEIIEKSQLTPITSLKSLTTAQKRSLIRRDKVLCSDLLLNETKWESMGIGTSDKSAVLAEAHAVCNIS